MSIDLFKEEVKSKEDLLRELRILRARYAVLTEAEANTKELREEIQLLKDLIHKTSEVEDLNTILKIVLSHICDFANWSYGEAWVPNKTGDGLICAPSFFCNVEGFDNFRKASEALGFKKDEGLPGKIWTKKCPVWVRDLTKEEYIPYRMELALAAGFKSAFGIPIISKDKVISVLLFFMVEVREEDQKLVSLITTVGAQLGGVFQRKELAEENKKVHEKFSGIFNSSKDAIGYAALDGTLLDVNDAFCNLVGYTKEELLNKVKYQDLTPEEYHEFEEEKVKDVVGTGTLTEYEKEYIRKDGTRVPVLLTVFLIRNGEGKPCGAAVIIKDITMRKQAEASLRESEEKLKKLNESLEMIVEERTEELRKTNKELEKRIREYEIAKEEIICSKEKYQSLVTNIPDVVWTTDSEGNTVFITSNVEKVCGYTADEICSDKNKKWLDRIHPDDLEKVKSAYNLLFTKGVKFDVEYRIQRKDGRWVWLHDRAVVTYERFGEKYADGAFSDITKRKQIEKAILESEEKYRKLIELANDAIFIADADTGIILDINKQAEELIGASEDKIIGKHYKEILLKDGSISFRKFLRQYLKYGKALSEELYLQHISGRKIPVEISVSTMEIGDKKIIQGICRDLTIWKQAIETKSQLAFIVESSDDAIMSWGLDKRNITWNKAAERIYGYTKEEIKGKHVSMLIPEERSFEEDLIFNKTISGEKIENYETKRKRKDGTLIDVSITISPIKDAMGNIVGLSSITRDITLRKKAEEALIEAQRKLTTLVNNLPGIAFRCLNDKDWTMEYLSEGCYELTGYKNKELIRNKVVSYNSLVHPDDREYVWEMVQYGINSRDDYVIEYRIKTRSGEEKWVWEKGCGVFSEDGKLLAIEGFITDITKEKKLLFELEERRQKEEQQKELNILDELTKLPQTDVLTQLFGFAPISKTLPDVFNELLKKYENLLLLAVNKTEASDNNISDELRFVSKQLGFLKASPSDVLEIHSKALKGLTKNLSASKIQAYSETGRKMALELMSYLVSYYRNYSLSSKRIPTVKNVEKKKKR